MASIDPGNLGEWYDAHAAALVLYARQLTPPGEAEDIVQDVFVRLMAQGRRPDHVRAWLFRSVRNEAISRLRSARRRRRRERSTAIGCREAFQSRPDELVDARRAEELLASLPRDLREAVVLRIWSGLRLREIAAVTTVSVPTVLRRYRAGLAALRKGMESSCRKKTT
jgi:RNA polymerase sigma factor (sigma-70 family)